MNKNIIFSSEKGNSYIYHKERNSVEYLHPIMRHILDLNNSAKDIYGWFNSLDYPYKIPNYGSVERNDMEYYIKKTVSLHLTPTSKSNSKLYTLKESDIEYFLSNIKNVAIEVTERCNLKCVYCAYGDLYRNNNERFIDIDFSTVKLMLDNLLSYWKKKENESFINPIRISFYGGEPLLNMKVIKKTVDYLNTPQFKDLNFSFGMTTNGYTIDKHIDYLIKNNFHLLISLDGNKQNNGFRISKNAKPSFDRVYHNIKLIQETNPEYFESHISFNSVIHKLNSINDIYAFFKYNFNKIPLYSEINLGGLGKDEIHKFKGIYSSVNNEIAKLDTNASYSKDFFFLPKGKLVTNFLDKHNNKGHIADYSQLIVDHNNTYVIPTGTCLPFTKKIFLTARGYILPCERIDYSFKLGEINNRNIYLDSSNIARRYNEYYNRAYQLCKKCKIGHFCTQCMFYMNINKQNIECKDYKKGEEISKIFEIAISEIEKNPTIYASFIKNITID